MKIKLFILLVAICGSVNAQYTKLLDFSGTANGSYPYGDLFYDGNFLYGMTEYGGSKDMGVIFKIKPDGSGYSKLLDFTGLNGNGPEGSFVSDGTFLYGMTSIGGIDSLGIIFKIKPDGSGFVKLLDFVSSTGNSPFGSLISDGTFLYGMTSAGGTHNEGTIFKIKPDGTGYSKLLDFTGVTNGSAPQESLISDGTFLYGMTNLGGTDSLGIVFKIKPDGTGDTTLLNFSGVNGNSPYGSLIFDGTFLYGMTNLGGTSTNCMDGCGVIFKIKPDGTGYSQIFDFAGSATGSNPFLSLISDGAFLYGMTNGGGSNSLGIIFKIKTDGTGFADLYDFTGGTDGGNPYGSLISDGTFLYGMTPLLGTNSDGTIFKLNPAGMGIAESNLQNDISIYPNPTNGIFTIQTNSTQLVADDQIQIYNVLGEKIYQSPASHQQSTIDISLQSSGVYFLKIIDRDGNSAVKKIIKE